MFLNIINEFIFQIKIRCVFFEVRTEFINIYMSVMLLRVKHLAQETTKGTATLLQVVFFNNLFNK
jgi:hypothetical protein